MIEDNIAKARASAEMEIEPLLRIFKHTLIETYVKGFLKGMESTEEEEAALKQLNEDAEALAEGVVPKSDEPLVRLKPDAILKRRLKREDFNTKVWRTLMELNIETLGDILQVSERFYLRQKGFGMGSLNALRNFVKQFGYKLKEK